MAKCDKCGQELPEPKYKAGDVWSYPGIDYCLFIIRDSKGRLGRVWSIEDNIKWLDENNIIEYTPGLPWKLLFRDGKAVE